METNVSSKHLKMKGHGMVQMTGNMVPSQERRGVANQIAETLGETAAGPQILIRRLVNQLGSEVSNEYLQRALEIERTGGMMNVQGTNRRTVGGIFFYLMKTEHPKETSSIFWKKSSRLKNPDRQPDRTQEAQSPSQPHHTLTWDERLVALAGIKKRGTVSAKMTLTGQVQPDNILDQQSCIILSMQSTAVPNIPKGVPVPPSDATVYTVYISHKLWKRVAQAAMDPEDRLIIDGVPRLDAETNSIAVIATNASSRKLKSAEKQKEVQ